MGGWVVKNVKSLWIETTFDNYGHTALIQYDVSEGFYIHVLHVLRLVCWAPDCDCIDLVS